MSIPKLKKIKNKSFNLPFVGRGGRGDSLRKVASGKFLDKAGSNFVAVRPTGSNTGFGSFPSSFFACLIIKKTSLLTCLSLAGVEGATR